MITAFAFPVMAQEASAPAIPETPVQTQPEPPASVPVRPIQQRPELVVRQISAIEFGTFASEPTGGTITISPSGGRIPSGGVTTLSAGFYGPAEFEIIGQPGEEVTIYLPDRVNLGKNGGNGGAFITGLTVLPGDNITLDNLGRGRIRVGGTLRIPANVSPGSYSGLFDIDVRYLH